MYAAYPYRVDRWSYVRRQPARSSDELKRFAGQASLEGGYAFNGLLAGSLGLRLGGTWFDFDSRLSYVFDVVRQRARYLGATHVNLIPVLLPRLIWRVGLGAQYLIDGHATLEGRVDYRFGASATTSLDVFPVAPLVLSAGLDFGSLGGVTTTRGRVTAGLIIRRFEFFAGWEHRHIGRLSWGGPLAGLKVWI